MTWEWSPIKHRSPSQVGINCTPKHISICMMTRTMDSLDQPNTADDEDHPNDLPKIRSLTEYPPPKDGRRRRLKPKRNGYPNLPWLCGWSTPRLSTDPLSRRLQRLHRQQVPQRRDIGRKAGFVIWVEPPPAIEVAYFAGHFRAQKLS